MALTRDDRFVLDDASATRLVDKLIRQTLVAPIGEERAAYTGRAHAFARFIRLYRRYVRRTALEDMDGNWVEAPPATARGGPVAANAVRALPLELRETLLLVALAGFSHREAAEALDIPLARFYERLDRARARLALHLSAGVENACDSAWRGAPYLRVIK